jgi:hypothetical protein
MVTIASVGRCDPAGSVADASHLSFCERSTGCPCVRSFPSFTTLLGLLLGLAVADSGSVEILGTPVGCLLPAEPSALAGESC